jgi:V/A-type H+-transporting ATPase subunit A
MMQVITRFIDLSEAAVARNVSMEDIAATPVMRRLRRMSEDIGEEQLKEFDALCDALEEAFTRLTMRTGTHAG